jgi:type IV pilus assembly protein PilY1
MFTTAITANAQLMADYSQTPPFTDIRQIPMVMLTLSADHQVFIKAYNDYDDLDGDDIVDNTYKPTIEYVGYFDSMKCYTYANGVYSIASDVNSSTSTVQSRDVNGNLELDALGNIKTKQVSNHYCDAGLGRWSGNFLNWVTMTRIDVVRLSLYGGYRSTDDPNLTVLERSYLPQDAHSFAKYYNGSDLPNLVDMSALGTACSNLVAGDTSCDGYTFCNTSRPPTGTLFSHELDTNTSPPLMRVVKGNYSLWATGERYQCLARADTGAKASGELQGVQVGDFWAGLNGLVVNGVATPVQGLSAFPDAPTIGNVRDFIVRVTACGTSPYRGSRKCQAYGNFSSKPVGLLQENGEVEFGLMTKGFTSNKRFGVLRKNVAPFTGNVDPDDDEVRPDGTFRARPVNLALTLQERDMLPSTIIGSLNALRIFDYRYKAPDNNNNRDGTYFPDCPWGLDVFGNGTCKNWGNPFNEIMTESYRYMAGAPNVSVTPTVSDRNYVPGLSVDVWLPPSAQRQPDDLACVNMSVLGFNASAVSYDGDDLIDAVRDTTFELNIGRAVDSRGITALTNEVGSQEIADNTKYFVGQATGAVGELDSGVCTAKSLTVGGVKNLASVRGTCPDAPRLGGSYLMSGLANFVYTNDMFDVAGTGKETITTFGVNLSGALPKIEVEVPSNPDKTITILPACHNSAIPNGGGNCAIIDFKVLSDPAVKTEGLYFVSYENSEQGGDYDQDINALIRYSFGRANGSDVLRVDTKIIGVTGPDAVQFGFVVSGTDSNYDGSYLISSAVNNIISNNCFGNTGTNGCAPYVPPAGVIDPGWQRQSIILGANAGDLTAGRFLESPLYYAAKWGSFDKSRDPAKVAPDPNEQLGYVDVKNPSKLGSKLDDLFTELKRRTGAGSAAGVSAGSVIGEGLVANTLYHPVYEGPNGVKLSWVGRLDGLFVDSSGRRREDSDQDGELTDDDYVVRFVFDGTTKDTKFYRHGPNATPAQILTASATTLPLDDLKAIWSAHKNLAQISDADIVRQRTYSSIAQEGRHIIVGIDNAPNGANVDGIVRLGEVVDFDTVSVDDVDNGLPDLLGLGAPESRSLVNYIRGLDSADHRNRSLQPAVAADPKTWRLGDIVHSTPAIVGRPSSGFDTAYGDETYAEFREKYRKRRQMVYVGANDGMLHAFNAGFVEVKADQSIAYRETYPVPPGDTAPVAHALGKEMWAYVPYNLLPHLKWLRDPAYKHVYYVDSKVQTFDVNIFGGMNQNVYPNGWGTILVVGMRFGGGPYGNVRATDGTLTTLRSAYIIMDITDPEQPPKLLAEITNPDLGFTLANVDVVKSRKRNNSAVSGSGYDGLSPADNQWFLLMGSGPQGPEGLSRGMSNRPARLFYLDLSTLLNANATPQLVSAIATPTIGNAVPTVYEQGFVGGLTAKDWDGDYVDDMVYVGLVGDKNLFRTGSNGQQEPAFNGRLVNAMLDFSRSVNAPLLNNSGNAKGFRRVLNSGENLPFSSAPLAVRDRKSNYWVFAGTGRFLVREDIGTGITRRPNRFFGINLKNEFYNPSTPNPPPENSTPWVNTENYRRIDPTSLRNVDLATIRMDFNYGSEIILGGTTYTSMEDYLAANAFPQYKGWVRSLPDPKEMNFSDAILAESTLFFNTFAPDTDMCELTGGGFQYALDMFTGLAATNLEKPLWALQNGQRVPPTGIQKKLLDERRVLPGPPPGSPSLSGTNVLSNSNKGEDDSGDGQSRHGTGVRTGWREVPVD